jgi:PAS domain S-box-containing protein
MSAVRLSATLGSVPDCTTFSYVHGSMAKAETTTNGSPAAALAGSDELARLLLDSTGEGIYVIDTKGDCTFANPACARLLGYDGEADLLGKNMHELMHHTRPNGDPYPNEECRVYVAVLQRQGTRVDDEVLWRKDGSSFPAEYSSYPMESDGELVGCVVTFMDISERIEVMDLNRSLMEMSTPVTQVWDKLLLLPLVGIIDTKRARDIMSAMLSEISETRARVFILDISGVGVIDTAVANHLIQITKATSLMGCDCIVSGVSPAIAQTIVELGIDVGRVQTTATMQDALVGAFERLGAEIREIV